MKETIIKGYKKIGLDYTNSSILMGLMNKIDLGKQYSLFHLDLILALQNIKEFDINSFNRYVNNLEKSGSKINFWGEKLEIFVHNSFIKSIPNIVQSVRRGKDGIEPDLIIDYNKTKLEFELTSCKFKNPPKNNDVVFSKIFDTIIEKSNKPYVNEKCALLIDITNITFYSKLNDFSIDELFNQYFEGFSYLNKNIGFGKIILCESIYRTKINCPMEHTWRPRIGLMKDSGEINPNLFSLLNIMFNNFNYDESYDFTYHNVFI